MTGRKSTRYQVFGKKRRFTIVFTSRIEVWGVKPGLRSSFVINSFRNDLFPEGVRVFPEKVLLCFRKSQFGRQPGLSWQGPFFAGITLPLVLGPIYLQAAASAADLQS